MPHADPDVRRAYYREWKKKAGKRHSNKYYDAARHANERAAKYGVPGRVTTADVRAVLDGKACAYCGQLDRVGLDHSVALALGGANAPHNLVPSCHSCNARKRRSDSLGCWVDGYDECVSCHLTEQPHGGKGLCRRCYNREANKRGPPRTKNGKLK